MFRTQRRSRSTHYWCSKHTFCPALAIGVIAERGCLGPLLAFTFWSTLVYDPIACWTWNLSRLSAVLGGLDFIPVHISTSTAALLRWCVHTDLSRRLDVPVWSLRLPSLATRICSRNRCYLVRHHLNLNSTKNHHRCLLSPESLRRVYTPSPTFSHTTSPVSTGTGAPTTPVGGQEMAKDLWSGSISIASSELVSKLQRVHILPMGPLKSKMFASAIPTSGWCPRRCHSLFSFHCIITSIFICSSNARNGICHYYSIQVVEADLYTFSR